MGKKLWLVLVIGYLVISTSTSARAQRQNDNLWTDPRSLTILMSYSPDFWPTLKTPAKLPANLALPLVKPASDTPITISTFNVSTFNIQRPTYQDYRESLFNRPLPGIRQYGIPQVESSPPQMVMKAAPMVTFPLPPQPIDLSQRPFTSPR
jgi:hypothetical protein